LPVVGGDLFHCVDQLEDCPSLRGQCSSLVVASQCKKTCGSCPMPRLEGSTCADQNTECGTTWSTQCTHPFVLASCPLTCNSC
jgi:hypothetical protein